MEAICGAATSQKGVKPVELKFTKKRKRTKPAMAA